MRATSSAAGGNLRYIIRDVTGVACTLYTITPQLPITGRHTPLPQLLRKVENLILHLTVQALLATVFGISHISVLNHNLKSLQTPIELLTQTW